MSDKKRLLHNFFKYMTGSRGVADINFLKTYIKDAIFSRKNTQNWGHVMNKIKVNFLPVLDLD